MGRILAIDYGKKRTGIAVTDTLQLIAGGLGTIATSSLMAFLTEYFSKEKVDKVIIGYPIQTNGKESENLPRVKAFTQKLKKTHPGIPVEWYDERFTSLIAQKAIVNSHLKKKQRQNKSLVDEISATIILQDYMESKRMIK